MHIARFYFRTRFQLLSSIFLSLITFFFKVNLYSLYLDESKVLPCTYANRENQHCYFILLVTCFGYLPTLIIFRFYEIELVHAAYLLEPRCATYPLTKLDLIGSIVRCCLLSSFSASHWSTFLSSSSFSVCFY